MKYGAILLLGLALGACSDSDRASPTPAGASRISSATMPPALRGDCQTYALLDSKCTQDWYQCHADKSAPAGSCSRNWESCCDLPGGHHALQGSQ